jgi:glycosidase
MLIFKRWRVFVLGSKLKISVIFVVLALLLSACAQNGSKTASDGYKYNHEMNVIDDNYRTYYEVFVYSFCDSNGDGIGDLNGLISKLDYISDMGFNGIWLMPIMPSTTYHKYDVIDYYSIDKQYGTLDDFKRLIEECNKRDIKVIIDLVLNHTSTQSEWFKSAVSALEKGQDSKYIGWYNFQKGKPASDAWYKAGNSEWCYEAKFWEGMPDLNLGNEELRAEIEKIAKFWLDLGVGGFRLDAAKEYYSGNAEKNIEVLKWFTDYCKSVKKDCYLVAEVWDGFSAFSKYYQSGIDSLFNFSFGQATGKITTTLNMAGSANSAKSYADALCFAQKTFLSYNPNAIDAPFFTNHDTGRAAGYFSYNADKIKLAWGMNLTMSGSAFVYYGEEIGMTGSGRDENKRAPMFWSNSNKEGMTNPPPNMETQENHFAPVDEQLKDNTSILNYVKRAIRLRNENPELARGILTIIPLEDEETCAVLKSYDNSSIIVVYNLSETEKQVTIKKSDFAYDGIRGYLSVNSQEPNLDGETLTMPAYAIVILK